MTDDAETERGMRLAASRPEVMPDQAEPPVQALYEDIQRTLRVPIVNLIFRTLANDPDYLIPAWQRFAPVLRTRALERAADQLREEALLTPVPDSATVRWDDLAPMGRVRAFNDTIHYVLPKLLLIATAWDEATFGGGGGDATEIPQGIAEGTGKEQMVRAEDADPRVRELFRREKEAHGHPLVSSYYRVLGNWPELLEALWTRLEPVVGTQSYRQRRDQLVRSATTAVQRLPLQGTIPDEARTADISTLLAGFRRNFIPSMMVDAGLIKAMLDGVEASRTSPLSAASSA